MDVKAEFVNTSVDASDGESVLVFDQASCHPDPCVFDCTQVSQRRFESAISVPTYCV